MTPDALPAGLRRRTGPRWAAIGRRLAPLCLPVCFAGCGKSDPPLRSVPQSADSGGADAPALSTDATSAEASPPVGRTYALLSETGLYSDTQAGTLAPGVEPFEPRFALWSDGAVKRRWISLPAGSKIDSTDMDSWKFPVGTKLWKEFSRDGVRVETRLIERAAATRWVLLAFQWNRDQNDAVAVPDGVQNASGTAHDIPSSTACTSCHTGAPDRVLGFSALQLAGTSGPLDLATLGARGALSSPPTAPFVVPGGDVAVAALGYLHANCGHCHNPASGVFLTANLDLRLRSASLAAVQDTPAWNSAVGQLALVGGSGGLRLRIAPGDPTHSVIVHRMALRGASQMPPLATETVDATGLAAVSAWIDSLGMAPDAGTDAAAAADASLPTLTDAAGPG